jgi:hypothetical protein
MRPFAITIFLSLLTFSCQKEKNYSIELDNLIGNWINPVYNDSLIIFERSGWTNIDSYCLSLKENGQLVERKNGGWCGTPPISYADFKGGWGLVDSLITINVGYWGGTAEYKWKVVSTTADRLKVIVLYQNYSSPFE